MGLKKQLPFWLCSGWGIANEAEDIIQILGLVNPRPQETKILE
jgi:hypothetical protein